MAQFGTDARGVCELVSVMCPDLSKPEVVNAIENILRTGLDIKIYTNGTYSVVRNGSHLTAAKAVDETLSTEELIKFAKEL